MEKGELGAFKWESKKNPGSLFGWVLTRSLLYSWGSWQDTSLLLESPWTEVFWGLSFMKSRIRAQGLGAQFRSKIFVQLPAVGPYSSYGEAEHRIATLVHKRGFLSSAWPVLLYDTCSGIAPFPQLPSLRSKLRRLKGIPKFLHQNG